LSEQETASLGAWQRIEDLPRDIYPPVRVALLRYNLRWRRWQVLDNAYFDRNLDRLIFDGWGRQQEEGSPEYFIPIPKLPAPSPPNHP
jgi:hypothetical protein